MLLLQAELRGAQEILALGAADRAAHVAELEQDLTVAEEQVQLARDDPRHPSRSTLIKDEAPL